MVNGGVGEGAGVELRTGVGTGVGEGDCGGESERMPTPAVAVAGSAFRTAVANEGMTAAINDAGAVIVSRDLTIFFMSCIQRRRPAMFSK